MTLTLLRIFTTEKSFFVDKEWPIKGDESQKFKRKLPSSKAERFSHIFKVSVVDSVWRKFNEQGKK